MKGICRECGTGFRGRADKKFCSDHCRNAYHNEKNRVRNNLLRTVNNRLRRNYRILARVLETGSGGRIPRSDLREAGFDFRFITGITGACTGEASFRVYDLQYQIDSGYCRIYRAGTFEDSAPPLFPVLRIELEGSHNDVLPADLPDEQPVLHDG